MTLFCPIYEEAQWSLSPMNAANNINGIGTVGRSEVYTLDQGTGAAGRSGGADAEGGHGAQRHSTTSTSRSANEPYFGGMTLAWQHRIADVIVETERTLPEKHLIAQNIANESARIGDPHPAVSIFNFHYATPPETVAMNYALNKVIGDNETGFRGTDEVYRTQGWEFVIAGGGLYNNLDYSFAVGFEDGTFRYPDTQPGGGGPVLRRQLRILRDFITSVDSSA